MTIKNAPHIFSSVNEASRYMTDCEDEFRGQVIALTERLISHSELRLIGLSGPTCAGKTTAASISLPPSFVLFHLSIGMDHTFSSPLAILSAMSPDTVL